MRTAIITIAFIIFLSVVGICAGKALLARIQGFQVSQQALYSANI